MAVAQDKAEAGKTCAHHRQFAPRTPTEYSTQTARLALSSPIGFTVRSTCPNGDTRLPARRCRHQPRCLRSWPTSLPKIAYDHRVGLDDEYVLSATDDAFKQVTWLPRYGIDVTTGTRARAYWDDLPVRSGMATGGAGLFRAAAHDAGRGAKAATCRHHVGAATGLSEDLAGWPRSRFTSSTSRATARFPMTLCAAPPRGLSTCSYRRLPVSSNASATGATALCGVAEATFRPSWMRACIPHGWPSTCGGQPFVDWRLCAERATASSVEFVRTRFPRPCLAGLEAFRRCGRQLGSRASCIRHATRARHGSTASGVDHGARQLDRAGARGAAASCRRRRQDR